MRPIPIITGPTGVGKTALSLDLVEALNGEIISADSRQVYREMNIGTAKPTPIETRGVPHHLIDILDITQPVSAGIFLRLASEAINDIEARGKTPIIVGGSTLYISSLTHGLASIPDISPTYREELESQAAIEGYPALFQELVRIDPQSASRMDASKSQRVVRALEVFRATGRTLSSFHAEPISLPHTFSLFILNRDRQELYQRIDRRVLQMIDGGLVEEVRNLRNGGTNDDLYALRSPGYRETISHLNGDISSDEMIRLIQRNTRRYAKRQLTWLRRYGDDYSVDAAKVDSVFVVQHIDANVFRKNLSD